MSVLDDLLSNLAEGRILDVRVGHNWTAVVADVKGDRRCGLAATLDPERAPRQAAERAMPSGRALAELARSDDLALAGLGVAAVNALLPPCPALWTDRNAEDVLAERGAGRVVALVGHFPFVPQLAPRVGKLVVLERDPQPGDLPASAAPEVLPHADVVAITAMTLINHSLDDLLVLCSPRALVLVLGPSTPLSPALFAHGVHVLSGAVVTAIEPVLDAIGQGADFRRVHRAGVRLVTMSAPGVRESQAAAHAVQP